MLAMPIPKLDLIGQDFDQFGRGMAIDVEISSGVMVEGEAAAYALVWEYGNVRQTKKGPKTVLGVSLATRETVWLSTQAPQGWIRVCEGRFWKVIKEEIKDTPIGQGTAEETERELRDMVNRVAQRMADILETTAPADTGQLKGSIRAVPAGSSELEEVSDYVFGLSGS